MTANSQLLTTTPKTTTTKKLSKELEQEQNKKETEITWRVSAGEWEGERGRKGTENK